jgi:hypothetical protein
LIEFASHSAKNVDDDHAVLWAQVFGHHRRECGTLRQARDLSKRLHNELIDGAEAFIEIHRATMVQTKRECDTAIQHELCRCRSQFFL